MSKKPRKAAPKKPRKSKAVSPEIIQVETTNYDAEEFKFDPMSMTPIEFKFGPTADTVTEVKNIKDEIQIKIIPEHICLENHEELTEPDKTSGWADFVLVAAIATFFFVLGYAMSTLLGCF